MRKRLPDYKQRRYDRAYGLFGVALLGCLLLISWGVSVLGGSGIGYSSPIRATLFHTSGLWPFLKGVVLIAIAFGVGLGARDGLEYYHETEVLRRQLAEQRAELSTLKWGNSMKWGNSTPSQR